jgi:hypothetical protein
MSTVEELKIKELNERKAPIVVIDKSLNKYDNVVLFPEKLAKANEILKKTGHPKDYLKEK